MSTSQNELDNYEHLLPPSWKTQITTWMQEGTPSSDYAGFVVGEAPREAFLLELASFQLSLKKSFMVCEAEARQVEEYQRERERIGEQLRRMSSVPEPTV